MRCGQPAETVLVAFVLVVLGPSVCAAEWQIRPYLGVAFAGDTTIADPELATNNRHVLTGVSGTLLGEIVGIEGDLSHVPKFFQAVGPSDVLSSRVTTLTGNIVLALPRRVSRYGLRPYAVAGGGFMNVYWQGSQINVVYRRTLPTVDVGGGVTGFLTNRVGVSWDLRYFKSLEGPDEGLSIGAERLSFWRAMMGAVIRVGRVTP